MELSQLRCFVATAEELHFSRAAKRLNMTQPPLSRQIKALEQSLGVILLARTNRSVRLTAAGELFLPEARRILDLTESAARWTRRVWKGETGVIRLGFTASTVYDDLPRLLAATKRELPEVKILLQEMVSKHQRDALLSDRLDAALIRPPIDIGQLTAERVRTDPFVAAIHREHPLANRPLIRVIDFDEQDFIMFSAEGAPYTNTILTDLFQAQRVKPNIVHQLDQNHSIVALVAAGLGCALVPASMRSLRFDTVIFRPVEMNPVISLELYLAWRPANSNPVLHSFLEVATHLFARPTLDDT